MIININTIFIIIIINIAVRIIINLTLVIKPPYFRICTGLLQKPRSK